MKAGFNFGCRVQLRGRPEITGSLSIGTMVAEWGWRNPSYEGEGFYNVYWDHLGAKRIAHEDDLELVKGQTS